MYLGVSLWVNVERILLMPSRPHKLARMPRTLYPPVHSLCDVYNMKDAPSDLVPVCSVQPELYIQYKAILGMNLGSR